MEGRVVRISIAPVKALHVVNPDEVELGTAGVTGDRRFWLVDANRTLVNGKGHPELMRVRPEWDEGSRRLALAFPDGSVVEGEVEPGGPFAAQLYGTPHPSRIVPGPWQEAQACWYSSRPRASRAGLSAGCCWAARAVARREAAVPVVGVISRARTALTPRRIAVRRTRLLPSTKANPRCSC